MLRLALNLASTRLILGHGNEGTDAAGHVIQAFGKLIMQGNFVIGMIVFAILVIVNFVVITKGSGRIAEVAARFTLDAMPGKQMAIDADLSAGLIDEKERQAAPQDLEAESNFFGAMDGASKFVRGDAIAGLLIVGINVIGGIIIGVAQQGMSFGRRHPDLHPAHHRRRPGQPDAGADRLHRRGPDGVEGRRRRLRPTRRCCGQLSFYPQALGMAAAVMGVVARAAGHADIWCSRCCPSAAGALAYYAFKRKDATRRQRTGAGSQDQAPRPPPKEEPIATALALDLLRVELGYGLLPLINDVKGHRITDQIKALRRQLAPEMGFVMPAVRILDNMQLGANEYRIRVKEVDSGTRRALPRVSFLVMDPKGLPIDLPGTHTTEPAFGLPATWIDRARCARKRRSAASPSSIPARC